MSNGPQHTDVVFLDKGILQCTNEVTTLLCISLSLLASTTERPPPNDQKSEQGIASEICLVQGMQMSTDTACMASDVMQLQYGSTVDSDPYVSGLERASERANGRIHPLPNLSV